MISSPAQGASAHRPIAHRATLLRAAAGILAMVACLAADGSWLARVPDADRGKANPYAGQADAIAAGSKIFSERCARCHGADAMGHGKRPSLRSQRVQNAKDGEIFWLLRNGNLGKGMPSWSALPEPSRWQVITYVKSLGVAPAATDAHPNPNSSAVPTENHGDAQSGPQR
jgi:mono/diheme cytochrome c family protein